MKSKVFNRASLQVVLLVAISALVYLPNGLRLTYFQDDWYYVYDGLIGGAKIFRYMFNIDRPGRGYFYELYFLIFGARALPYHLGEFIWRAAAMLGMFWLIKMLWAKENKFAFFTTLLLALYPGYFWWISAIDYQPHIVSLALQILSIAFTLKAISTQNRAEKILWTSAAIFSGWGYIALVDYAVGMEFFRAACIYLLIAHEQRTLTVVKKLRATIQAWLVFTLIPLGYVIWKTFFFENQRKATDIGFQLSALAKEPAAVLSKWMHLLYSSAVTVGLSSWIEQFKRQFFELNTQDMISGLIIAAIIFIFLVIEEQNTAEENNALLNQTSKEALALGFLGLTIGIIPVILANRYINLDFYAHYGLPASLAGVIFLAGLIQAFGNRRIRFAFFSIAIILASLTHYAISKRALNQETAIEKFWWQVSWRIPSLYPDSTLVTHYPYKNMGEDDFGLVEPANMIYFPEPRAELPIRYPISVLNPTDQNVEYIESGQRQKMDVYRTHETVYNYDNILILSQPTPESCVRVTDGARYLASEFDPGNVKRIAHFSKIDIVRITSESKTPLTLAFGAEPERGWCYYFEKADFAVQQQNWKESAKLGDEAFQLKLSPADPVEWFPFLQTYIMLEDEDKINLITSEMNKSQFLHEQACLISSSANLDPKIKDRMNELFCK